MATVSPQPAASSPKPPPVRSSSPDDPLVVRIVDAIYHFLASLKLAVILLSTLAAVLAYATFYESSNGTHAVQVDIYQSRGFALLLAMLGVNILCAALIRYPWTKRQTGFVITHAGLLVVLLGSFLSFKMTDEGRVGLDEGSTATQYFRTDAQVIRLQKLNPQTMAPERQFVVPFSPGAQPWETNVLAAKAQDASYLAGVNFVRGLFALLGLLILGVALFVGVRYRDWVARPLGAICVALLTTLGLGLGTYAYLTRVGPRTEVLTQPDDPFRLVAKDFLPASSPPRTVYAEGRDGVPAARVALLAKPPGKDQATDALDGRGWIAATSHAMGHGALDAGPARVELQHLEGPHAAQALDAFLHPPAQPMKQRAARIYYTDQKGESRVYEWVIDDERLQVEPDKTQAPVTLPDSDITVTLGRIFALPTRGRELRENGELIQKLVPMLTEMGAATGSPLAYGAFFRVRKADGPEVMHAAWAGLPMIPNVGAFDGGSDEKQIVYIDFYNPPVIEGSGMSGRFGVIQLVTTGEDKVYARAFGRNGLKGEPGPIQVGQTVPVFGGEGMPMSLALRVDEVLHSAVASEVCDPIVVPKNEMDSAIPATLIELGVGGQSREFWLRRSDRLGPSYQEVRFSDGPWRISYDFDARPLPFEINLIDFDPSNDPGATARAAYRSDVTVREPSEQRPQPKPFAEIAQGGYFLFSDRPREVFRKLGPDAYEPFDGGERLAIETPASTEVQPIQAPTKITMNNPMIRKNWTFYQTAYEPIVDRFRQPTGRFKSILTVRYDPVWPVVYGGCLLVVLGTFVQFYMRAGVFTDGGKKARQRAEARVQPQAQGGTTDARRAAVTDIPEDL